MLFSALGAPMVAPLYSVLRLISACTSTFGKENHKNLIRPEMADEMKRVLPCPFSHETLRDPVTLLVLSGHTFDR